MFEHSDTLAKIATALAAAQPQFGSAIKDSENPHFRSRFATLASVWDAIREPLSANGLSVTQLPGHDDGRITVRTVLLHTSGEWIACSVSLRPVKDDPQGVGSAITYGRRYGLEAVTGIPREDDDGESSMGRGPGRRSNGGALAAAQRKPGPKTASLISKARALADKGVGRAGEAARALQRDVASGISDDDIAASAAAGWVRDQSMPTSDGDGQLTDDGHEPPDDWQPGGGDGGDL